MTHIKQSVRRKILSAIVIAALALSCLVPLGADPAGSAAYAAGAPTATVKISYQKDAKVFPVARQEKKIAANLSEQYGYVDSENGAKVTALDAVVAAHIVVFGTDKAVINSKLSVGSNGFASNFMGDGAGNLYYYVNGESVYVAAGDKLLSGGDIVELFSVQDTTTWSDKYSWFEIGGKRTESITINPGDTVDLTLKGLYAFGSYSDIVSGAGIVPVKIDGVKGEIGKAIKTTDNQGKASVKFAKPGVFIISAINVSSVDKTPLSSPWLAVTVKSSDAKLKKLTVSTGTLSPKFKASKESYKLKLKAKKSTVKITPVRNFAKAKIQIKVGTGKYKNVKNVKVTLKKGKSKTIKIKVIAENKATKVYTVKVSRAKR